MPSKQSRARHAAPRDPSRTRAVLPGVLLAAAGTAFAGLAVMPAAAADTTPRVNVAHALAPVQVAPVDLAAPVAAAPANVALMSALQKGSDIVNAPPPPPPPPPPRVAERASRDRSDASTDDVVSTSDGEYARPGTGRLTSGYGRRWGRLHAGIDLAAGTGSPIYAVTDGVVKSGCGGGYGNCVKIVHSDGSVSLYAHMSSLMVRGGEKVSAGEQIGREGSTGNSTGPHLHFEIHINGTPVNPVPWLNKRGIRV